MCRQNEKIPYVRHYVCFVAEAPHVGGKAAAAVGSQRTFVPYGVHFAVMPAQHKQGEGAFEHICRFEHRLQRVAAVVCLEQVSHHSAVRVGGKGNFPHKLAQLGVVFYDTVVAYGKIAVRRQKGMGVLSAHLSVSCPPRVPYRRLGADIFRKAFGKLPYAPFTLVQQNIPCQRRYTSRIVAAILQKFQRLQGAFYAVAAESSENSAHKLLRAIICRNVRA